LEFRRVLPPGWTVQGSARSDIHLRVPESQSESEFQIRAVACPVNWKRPALRPTVSDVVIWTSNEPSEFSAAPVVQLSAWSLAEKAVTLSPTSESEPALAFELGLSCVANLIVFALAVAVATPSMVASTAIITVIH